MTLIPKELRELVVRRAGNRCEYCHLLQASQVATFPVDHVVPVVLHGLAQAENLCLACPRCNARKWTHVEAADPDSGRIALLFNPRMDVWAAHFRWSTSDSCILEARTATGRATIALLDLNSPRCVAIRRWLAAIGLHPAD